jgi:hypothetical protein
VAKRLLRLRTAAIVVRVDDLQPTGNGQNDNNSRAVASSAKDTCRYAV